jgi:hypothetical protein
VGDPAAGTELTRVQTLAQTASHATSGPLWQLVGHVPVIGDNTDALVAVSQVVDLLASDVLPRLATAASVVTPANLAPVAGAINLAPIRDVRHDVVAADTAVNAAIERLSGMDRSVLIAQVSEAVDGLEGQLRRVAPTTRTAARAVELLPALFGAGGPRDWLVLAQNNAEQRATGGIPGALLRLSVDNGRLDLTETASTSDFHALSAPIVELTNDESSLFGTGLGRWIQNVNFTPDFPRTAYLSQALWQMHMGSPVQGVVSIDPVVVAYLLETTGPVSFQDPTGETVTLTSQNAAEFLMAGVYEQYLDPRVQDLVFATAAHTVFQQVMGGGADANAAVNVLVRAAEQGRLMVWSAVPAEQALISGTVLSGELRGSTVLLDGTTAPVAGVYFNLSVGSKIGFYLDADYHVESVETRPDGSQTFDLRVTLHNRLTTDQAAALPPYVIGNGNPNGAIELNLLGYAPFAGNILKVTDSAGQPIGGTAAIHKDLAVSVRNEVILPGETRQIVYSMVSGPAQPGTVQVRMTPGPQSRG